MARITDEHFEHWQRHGYVVVERFLTDDELAAARENIARYMPTGEEYAEAPRRYRETTLGLLYEEFPFTGEALNAVTTHPDLVAFAERILGTDDLALSHAQLVGKYAGAADYEQELHVDYVNNTLAYPKDDTSIFDLPSILYYSDVTEELGPTYAVSQEHTRGDLLHPYARSREAYPELYEHEFPVTCPAGSILIYSMRTFHRGSRMHAPPPGARFSHHIGFRTGAHRWMGQMSFQQRGGSPEMDAFIESATPRQRELVGFPPVGHAYWDEETLAGVAARYPGLDLAPYRDA